MSVSRFSAIALGLLPATAVAATGADAASPFVLGGLALVLVAARLAGHAASLVGQPAVLGELLAGIVLGNLSLAGWAGLEPLERDPGLALLAELGVILLLFEVGRGRRRQTG